MKLKAPSSLIPEGDFSIPANSRLARKVSAASFRPSAARPPQETTLAPYSGAFGVEQAAHLLRRSMFGFNYSQLQAAVGQGLEVTVDKLLEDKPMPEPPVYFNYDGDPDAGLGETWVYSPYYPEAIGPRRRSLAAWTAGLMVQSGAEFSIREKMVLFWHNHFVASEIPISNMIYIYSDTLRRNALGNIRQFAKEITIDPAMLLYLNGNLNTRFAPNENYARELLELFTIGKGDLAGPGDYTTFTEDDVVAMAKVLTGWRFRELDAGPGEFPIQSFFQPNLHDTSTKTLSHRFDNIEIQNNGEQEYADLIDIIFTRDEVARFMSRNLYRWFVHYKIDAQIEQNVIEPLAQLLIDNDYEVKPALRALLLSEHFFDADLQGCMIKNPFDFGGGIFNSFDVEMPSRLAPLYQTWLIMYEAAFGLQMAYYAPPQVAGWKAYYQDPTYYRMWINSNTIPLRSLIADVMAFTGIQVGDTNVGIDVFGWIEQFPDPSDPNELIEDAAKVLLPRPVTTEQTELLKEALIPGLPDFEWTVEYNNYLANPDDEQMRISVELKLRSLIRTIMHLPEFNLS